MRFFEDLGSLIEQRWRERAYDEEVFPDIAAEALAEANPSGRLDPWEIIRWLNTTKQLPEQHDPSGSFGDPPITVYDGAGFYIDVYFWMDGTTSIHQHAFCGAFQVFIGSSILSEFTFAEKERLTPNFLIGDISFERVELLKRGDVRQILAGRRYIHSLFHLERPSATVVVRTVLTESGLPQFRYRAPYFAVDPFFRSTAVAKKVHSASLLLRMRHPEAQELIGQMLANGDLPTALSVLEMAYGALGEDQLERAFGVTTGEKRFDTLLRIARQSHGEVIDLLMPVLEEHNRQQNLVMRRGQITANDHRFFLALLLNVPDRERVLALVAQRFPECDPVNTVMDWVEELASTKVMGSTERNVLGLNDFDEDYAFVLECMFEGLTLEQIIDRFEKEFASEDVGPLWEKLTCLYKNIRESMVFRSIFLESRNKTLSEANTGASD